MSDLASLSFGNKGCLGRCSRISGSEGTSHCFVLSACGPFIVLPCSNHENSEGHSPAYAPARLKICNVPSLNISVLAQSKVGSYFRLHLGNRCSGTDGQRISFKKVKENPLPSPFFAICEGAVKAFNAVGDIIYAEGSRIGSTGAVHAPRPQPPPTPQPAVA